MIMAAIGFSATVYALFFLDDASSKKSRRKLTKDSPEGQEISFKDQKISKLEDSLGSLRSELEKARTDYVRMQNQAEHIKKQEDGLKEELVKRDSWVSKGEELLDKVKERQASIEETLKIKERELTAEFSKNVNLQRDLRDLSEKFQLLAKENKEKSDEIESLKALIERKDKELERRLKDIQAHINTIADMKKKAAESEWVSSDDYDASKEEIQGLTSQLDLKKKELEIRRLALAISQAELEIGRKNDNIGEVSDRIETNQKALSASLFLLYMYDQDSALTTLLKNNSLSDYFSTVKSIEKAQVGIDSKVK